jgi:hypothetical protein
MAGMACAEHDRLRDALVQAMLAEDRTRDSGWVAAGVSVTKRIEAQQGAHLKVSLAETLINRHIDGCELCRAEGQQHHNATLGQF